ncbi:hypothetical protein DL768_006289 [Monosporascus sp. mg162]|nr:hypothetical protein DL768_006289 [Monosporascus sp. mg162]
MHMLAVDLCPVIQLTKPTDTSIRQILACRSEENSLWTQCTTAKDTEPDTDAVANQYISMQRAAGDIVNFVQELGEEQQGGLLAQRRRLRLLAHSDLTAPVRARRGEDNDTMAARAGWRRARPSGSPGA